MNSRLKKIVTVLAGIGGVITANVGFLPDRYRVPVASLGGFLVGLPILARRLFGDDAVPVLVAGPSANVPANAPAGTELFPSTER